MKLVTYKHLHKVHDLIDQYLYKLFRKLIKGIFLIIFRKRRVFLIFWRVFLYIYLIKLVIAMLLCTVIGYFGLQPFMAELRSIAAQSGGVMDDAVRSRFGLLHGAASAIYLIQSVLAFGLVLKSK